MHILPTLSRCWAVWLASVCLCLPVLSQTQSAAERVFRAGASVVDITPTNYPVIVNAMFEERSATNAADPLRCRSLVLDDGRERIVIAVVDTCMMPRELIDQAKAIASYATGIPPEHMLVSATHTHSAPAAMGCLGSRVDPDYARMLPGRVAAGIIRAVQNLQPARVGWGAVDDYAHTFCRRWIRRPDRLLADPFGDKTVRANMHPGYQSPDAIAPSGPVDPALSLLSVQTRDGKPLAVLANYSMHYYESPLLSADYYGVFATKLAALIGGEGGNEPFVGIMSQGTSGDQMWMDYGRPARPIGVAAYAQEVAEVAAGVWRKIQHQDWVSLAMAQTNCVLNFRVPDVKRLAWARDVVAKQKGPVPRGMAEIYAHEAIYLHQRPQADLLLQALRIGELGIVAIPNEVFALTGLKIKAQSPLPLTFNIELANGAEGYIPPAEQHWLGGYTTWPARTAGLEVGAEARIVAETLGLLETVSDQRRKPVVETPGEYTKAVLQAQPLACWRLNEFSGPTARDASGHGRAACFESSIAFYLDGPQSPAFSGAQTNRAPHFAGGRLRLGFAELTNRYSVSFWFWNGLTNDVRDVTGYLFSQGPDGVSDAPGGHLGLGGLYEQQEGRLFFYNGNRLKQVSTGYTVIAPKTWNQVVLVREGSQTRVFLNGNLKPEIESDFAWPAEADGSPMFLGGRSDNYANFEGKLDEVAVFDRALSGEEVATLYRASGMPAKPNALPPQTSSTAKSPAESLAMLHVKEGFVAELMAAEPLITSPVALDWGLDGRLWVVEMVDYPMGMNGRMQPGGRVRFLQDTKGNGVYDQSTVFMEGVRFPNGIISWGKGVIITAAPDIIYAEDTDGDGKADKFETLYSGFAEGNLQLRVNGLRWGLDNWLHCANGWSGGQPRSAKTGTQIDLNGRDLRLEPTTGLIEVESGQSEFGRNRTDWDDWFGCDNSFPLFHFVLEDRYMRRNPYTAAPSAKRQVYLPANPKVYPLSEGQKRFHTFDQAGHFTSACSTDFYRDELLFARGGETHVFTCEPVHNLVQHLLMSPEGTSFSARRAEAETEPDFLASRDQWFRPVMARTGPDGALWIADMYRYMIEHPDWLPPEGRRELAPFYRLGEERGRIYRVFPQGKRPQPGALRPARLDTLSAGELVALLESPSGWIRDKAQQLLIWKHEVSVVPALAALAARGVTPLARVHALCTLDGLGALTPALLESALSDPAAGVRRHAVRLTETRAGTGNRLGELAARLADDPDPQVRLQLALTLGAWQGPAAGVALARLAVNSGSDPAIAAATLSSAVNHAEALIAAVTQANNEVREVFADPLLDMSLALDRRDLVMQFLRPTLAPADGRFTAGQFHAFTHFVEALARKKLSFKQYSETGDERLRELARQAETMVAQARLLAADATHAVDLRVAALGLLGRSGAGSASDISRLAVLLQPSVPGEVQRAAVQALGRAGDEATPGWLLADWPAHSPATRATVFNSLLGRETWALELLRRLEHGQIVSVDLEVAQRDRLLKHSAEKVRQLAGTVFAATINPDRQKAIASFQPALLLTGDVTRGRAIFAKTCATCHQLDGVGREVGPNLISVKAHPPEKLLTSILDPSREVEPRYLAYNCELTAGDELYGIIASETGNGLVFKLPDGTTRNILRSDIKSLRSTKLSLMPDGLEAALTHQDLADLLRYLRHQPGVE